ncbi:hypothetical protein [Streptomyces erythrochromogenes]|uniref:hypothetical protein n=1 Tax=Streptomyces erythrochromogenes TaxID=285574 RepID=UPI00386A8624|nr:hypothetical protein OG489_38795 [Streptomyces erythrochromogenes]
MRIPPTGAGLVALEECLAQGIGVDPDLVFSVERYEEVLGAVLRGLERALPAGLPLGGDRRDGLGAGGAARRGGERPPGCSVRDGAGDGARHGGPRGRPADLPRPGGAARHRLVAVLCAAGAMPPGLLRTAPGPGHVGALVGWNTAQAAPPEVFEMVSRQVELRGDTLLNAHADGQGALAALEALGIRMADVARTLEAAELDRLRREWRPRP